MERIPGVYSSIEDLKKVIPSEGKRGCPLCPESKFKCAWKSRLDQHLDSHWKTGHRHEDQFILRCSLTCRHQPHYHCPECQDTVLRKCDLVKHLNRHSTNDESAPVVKKAKLQTTKTSTGACEICGEEMLASNIARHKRNQHHLQGLKSVCVDPNQGIFLVRKALSGNDTPLHVIKRSGTSNDQAQCELDICVQLSQAAARGNQPGFECQHLQAVQNAESFIVQPALEDWALDDMIDNHWLKESRKKACIQLRALAVSNNVSPVYPWIPERTHSQRYLHFSVISETKTSHYWCRFGRVVVSYDTNTAVWKCACSPAKRPCVHKALSMWFTRQELPHVMMSCAYDKEDIMDDADDEQWQQDIDEQWWQDYSIDDEKWMMEEDSGVGQHTTQHTSSKTNKRIYPPTGTLLTRMLTYIQTKKIPSSFSQELLTDEHLLNIESITPEETHCQLCSTKPVLEKPMLVTNQAQVVTLAGVKKGIRVYCKFCPICETPFRYQRYADGLHNFDDHLFLSIKLCVWFRNSLQNHVAVGRVVATLEETFQLHLVHDTVLKGYLHFEALCEHSYEYYCIQCGYYPPVIVMDLNKKGVFKLAVSELSEPPCQNCYDTVDADTFWSKVEYEMLTGGFTPAHNNPYTVKPSYTFWAPWIGHDVRDSNELLNTEHRKCHRVEDTEELAYTEVSEDRLIELLHGTKVAVVQELCRKCGISDKGSKVDCVLRLRDKLSTRSAYDKVFSKIWGASGGWLSASCPHKVVYAVKFVLRTEGPRDYIDLLLSMRHQPNVVIVDMAHMVAKHGNNRMPGMFSPFEGRLVTNKEENIKAAEEGSLSVSLPWLTDCFNKPPLKPTTTSHDHQYTAPVHPLTGTGQHFCLFDVLHQANSKKRQEILRRTQFVPQLSGLVNTQAEEQLHRSITRDIYYLDTMTPSHHIFLLRLILHIRNERINNRAITEVRKRTRTMKVLVSKDNLGRLVTQKDTSEKSITPASKDDNPTVLETAQQQLYLDNTDGTTVNSITTPEQISQNSCVVLEETTPEQILHLDDIDATRACWGNPLTLAQQTRVQESISKGIYTNLTPKSGVILYPGDLKGLIDRQWLTGETIDALLGIFSVKAAKEGCNVYVIDNHFMTTIVEDYTVELWISEEEINDCDIVLTAANVRHVHWCLAGIDKLNNEIFYLDPLGGKQSAQAKQHIEILSGIVQWHLKDDCSRWKIITADDLQGLPTQGNSHDCGVFTVMYGLHRVLRSSAYDFTTDDMVQIRRWLSLIIVDCAHHLTNKTHIRHRRTRRTKTNQSQKPSDNGHLVQDEQWIVIEEEEEEKNEDMKETKVHVSEDDQVEMKEVMKEAKEKKEVMKEAKEKDEDKEEDEKEEEYEEDENNNIAYNDNKGEIKEETMTVVEDAEKEEEEEVGKEKEEVMVEKKVDWPTAEEVKKAIILHMDHFVDIIKGTTKSHHYDIIARGSARQKNAIKMTAMGRAMFKYSSDELWDMVCMLESAFTMAKVEADADFKFQVAHDAFFREALIAALMIKNPTRSTENIVDVFYA